MPASIFLLIAIFFGTAAFLGSGPSQNDGRRLAGGAVPGDPSHARNPVLLERSVDMVGAHLHHLDSIGTIMMLSAVLMLTASGLSVLLRDSVDINRELTVAGFTCAISG